MIRVPTAFWKKNSRPIKKNSRPIFNKFSGKNSRPKIYLINSTHQKYLQLCTCDVQHMHLCGLEKCLLFIKRLLKFTNLLFFILHRFSESSSCRKESKFFGHIFLFFCTEITFVTFFFQSSDSFFQQCLRFLDFYNLLFNKLPLFSS